MQHLSIRPATLNDLPTLLQFEQGIINAERPFDSTLKTENTSYYDLPAMIASPQVALLVAELDGKIIGSGYARVETAKPYLKHKQHAYLGFMYVLPAYRGQGVNMAVMEALEAWTRLQGITELRLDVYYENEAAVKAYEKVGFTKHMLSMRKGL